MIIAGSKSIFPTLRVRMGKYSQFRGIKIKEKFKKNFQQSTHRNSHIKEGTIIEELPWVSSLDNQYYTK